MIKPFIIEIDTIKRRIEKQYAIEFSNLHKTIANDVLNLVKVNQKINYIEILKNYKPDYIAIYRKIFSAVNKQLGWDVRKKLNFHSQNKIEIKSNIQVSPDIQDKINATYNYEYTLLLNNYTEELANDDFFENESEVFDELYADSITEIEIFLKKQQNEYNKNILILSGLSLLIPSQARRRKLLEKQNQALLKQLQDIKDNKQQKIYHAFKAKLQNKIEMRARQNSEYVVGQATREIRNLESNTIAISGVVIDITSVISLPLSKAFVKIWREYTQYIPKGKPRPNHLALDGVQANEEGLWYVSGIMSEPRGINLGADETAFCRCEYENVPNW